MNYLKNCLIEQKLFHLQEESTDLKNILKIGTDLLKEKNFVDQNYFSAIWDTYKKLGPYFAVAPGLAMPHAKPEEGALGNAFSLVTVKTPICVQSENDPLFIFLFFCAKNYEDQVGILIKELGYFLDNDENIEKLKKATCLDDLKLCQF